MSLSNLKILLDKMRGYNQIRNISYKSVRTWYANLVKPRKIEPPYKHVVQIGDPTLRTISERVPVDLITSSEVKFVIKQLKSVFKKYKCVGLSATQIGIPMQIFLMEFNKNHGKMYSKEEQKTKEMTIYPLTVVINPEIKILDYTKVIFPESCESVKGFYADVPRYRALALKGLDENGQMISLNASGWLARIIQHEMDHLNGKTYVDIMDRKSLTCSCWNIVNERGGRVELPYGAD